MEVPLSLRLTGSPSGKPDLQLQLFSLRLGEAACHPRGPPGSSRHSNTSPYLTGPALTLT